MWHPGISCSAFCFARMKTQLMTGFKVSAIFIALPALVQSFKKIKENPKELLGVIEKWIRSTI